MLFASAVKYYPVKVQQHIKCKNSPEQLNSKPNKISKWSYLLVSKQSLSQVSFENTMIWQNKCDMTWFFKSYRSLSDIFLPSFWQLGLSRVLDCLQHGNDLGKTQNKRMRSDFTQGSTDIERNCCLIKWHNGDGHVVCICALELLVRVYLCASGFALRWCTVSWAGNIASKTQLIHKIRSNTCDWHGEDGTWTDTHTQWHSMGWC